MAKAKRKTKKAEAKPVERRVLTVDEICQAVEGFPGQRFTTQQIFAKLGIGSAKQKGPLGDFTGPKDADLTRQALQLLTHCSVENDFIGSNRRAGRKSPIEYWSHNN